MALLLALVTACGKDDPGLGVSATGEDGTGDSDGGDDALFDEEVAYPLRLNEDPPPSLELQMTREEVAELFGDQAESIHLLSLDPTALLGGTLDALRNACGTDWELDSPDPNHDCTLTELGQQFGGQAIAWQLSAEYALVRLLTMTPANADVTGTSSESLQQLVDALASVGEIPPFGVVLADALGIEVTDPVVSRESLVTALRENFVATHPAVGEQGTLDVTLADALADMAPLADRYGPQGDHPGVVAGEVNGEVFGPGFVMRVRADSNLRIMDGVDASIGKGFVTTVDDRTGPSFDDALEFDFDDPARFGLEGVADDLRVDLRVRLVEHDQFVDSCVGDPPCQGNLPGDPVDESSVWSLAPWSLERIVAKAAYFDYVDRIYYAIYVAGLAQIHIGQESTPPGWIHYEVEGGLGDPPGDQYLWETVLEVAQVALHQTPFNDFEEGTVDVAFTVPDVPVGLTGAEAADAVRPFLKAQASTLSDLLLGNYRENNDPVDFHFRRAEDGQRYLFFAAADDLPVPDEYAYPSPGFFADADLTDKVSALERPGLEDTIHEKIGLQPGETVLYFADDLGDTYRLRVQVPDDDDVTEIEVRVARRVG